MFEGAAEFFKGLLVGKKKAPAVPVPPLQPQLKSSDNVWDTAAGKMTYSPEGAAIAAAQRAEAAGDLLRGSALRATAEQVSSGGKVLAAAGSDPQKHV